MMPPADDCVDALVVHAQSSQEMADYMWELGFDTAEFETVRHAIVVQIPLRTVVVLLNAEMEVVHAESCEGVASEEDIRRWKKQAAEKGAHN